jgi:FkbM family methyltransferase
MVGVSINPFDIAKNYHLAPITSVLQVGASGGQEIPMFLAHGVSHAAMIEPLDYPFSVLRANCEGIANYLPIQSLVGARDGEQVELFVASNDGQSSSILKPAQHLDAFPSVSFDTKIQCTSFTLDTIARSIQASHADFPAHYDLIYVDVQGAELEVFKGANQSLLNSRFIFTEIGLGGGYEGDVSYMKLIGFLNAYGYDLIQLEINPSHGYGDALFVRRQ